ncbi:DUF4381 domain-containing protein [Persicirhabdus sediminis]|uniref:DUF4381 domain-containing protein n=1 Tax=Persicirhabdus sediminis TaxID=454144 RepID=A0A8J7MEX4_9BACT|nr:DUF4381 domain-containing protein [Persicirhabdus sediminis]MBK1791712.1 DUF4381 domain-containing protein [Persicirhabdus sediminis]
MKKVFEPEWGNPSLRTIVEAEFPEPVSLVPVAPGWWLLLIALIALLMRVIWRRRQAYLRDSYRREALAQLATIKDQLDTGNHEPVRELAPLLRATAIAALGRESVSGLQGDDYANALAKISPQQDRLPVADLQRLAYAPLDELGEIDTESLIAALEGWILKHRRDYA